MDYFYKIIVNKSHREKIKHSTVNEVSKNKNNSKCSTKNEHINETKCETFKKEKLKKLIDILNKEFYSFLIKYIQKNIENLI